MKTTFALLAASAIAISASTYAEQPVNQAALSNTQITPVTVTQAKSLKDNSKVTLKGQVVRSLGNEKYEFKDATGTIVADIDDELWKGQPISNTATVTLVGEIDHDNFPTKTVEVDVDEFLF